MKKSFILFLILFFEGEMFAQTPTRTVNLTSSSWSAINKSNITDALSGLSSGTIWVAAGTYTETTELTIPQGVTVIGGFPATAITLTQRVYPGVATSAQLTILSGSFAHRVATVFGTLDGCVITKGYAYDPTGSTPLNGAGGGVMINTGIVQNCILHDNVAAKKAPTPGNIPGTFVASIGDIYCTDGTILHPTYTLNSSGNIVATLSGGIPSGKTPQGIVFYVDTSPTTGHFLIMGQVTTSTLSPWFNCNPTNYDFPLANITTLAGAMADFNGQSNSTSLNTQFNAWLAANPTTWYAGWNNSIPIPYCLSYNTPYGTLGDWYLPAAGELYKIWSVYPQMDACASSVLGWISSGSSMFHKYYYWSSSEYDANNVWVLDTTNYP